MKIRTQLIISMVFFGIVLLIISASVIITNQQVEQLNGQQELVKNIELKANELSYLSNDYLMYRENQQIDRWESKYSSFSSDVLNLTVNTPDQQMLVNNIKANQQRLKEIFEGVASSTTNTSQSQINTFNPEFVQVSSSRLGIQTQGIVFDASRLSQKLHEEEEKLNQLNILLISALLGTVVAFLLTNYFLIYRRTLNSLSNLQAGTKIIGSGNLDFSITDKKDDEFGELSNAFNLMTSQLRMVTTSKTNLEKEIIERKWAEKALKEARDNLEIKVKERTEELEEAIEELKRSNYELQQFAYITSHDLQEPLRTIASFTQLIERRYKGKLDSDADEYIDFVVDAATRMKQMIIDLLEYSKVGTSGHEFKPVNVKNVIDETENNLKSLINENNAQIIYDSLPPTLMADKGQLVQLFQNLIGNAIKFRKEDIPPKIHISAQKDKEKGEYLFSVADNGIGMEQQYSDKIFEVFKRLHTIDKYQGTGIGLAIVKRIVERHGGRIWVESESGKGSVFYFTLQKS